MKMSIFVKWKGVEMSSSIVKISFDFTTLEWTGITKDQVIMWENAYPDMDVVDILTKKMPAWMDANPRKAKKKNYKRFIVNWLSRQQDAIEKRCF